MLIVADENIPHVCEAFGGLGTVRTVSPAKLAPEAVRQADVLLVRSVTRVDSDLLRDSAVRFVGTATAGCEHVDLEYLNARGIKFAPAHGANAQSVAEYVAAALCQFSRLTGRDLRWKTIGIVGVGHCGSGVERIVQALEMDTVLCDPPLARATNDPKYQDKKYLQDCDFITAHVPLTDSGPDATAGMFNSAFFDYMKPGFGIINAARGGIMNEMALLRATQTRRVSHAALDVWFGEPRVDADLLQAVTIGTPHIAGYAIDAKLRATEMLYRAACEFLDVAPAWSAAGELPEIETGIEIDPGSRSRERIISDLILGAYPIMRDDAAMRRIIGMTADQQPAYFDSMRRDYPRRREFSATRVHLNPHDETLACALRSIGFRVERTIPRRAAGVIPSAPSVQCSE